MKEILGNGLLVSEAGDHKVQKRGLLPAFTRRQVELLYPCFCEKARESINLMALSLSSDQSSEIDIENWASRYALDVIGLAGFGKDFGSIQDESNPLVENYNAIFNITTQKRILFFLGAYIPWNIARALPFLHNGDLSKAIRVVRQSCQEVIDKKREASRGKSIQGTDLLSIAMNSGRFSDENLIDQVMTFLGAGHETTATVLTWAIYALALFPQIQRELRDEIRKELPTLHAGVDYQSSDVNRLPFLHAVCNEVLRLFTPVRLTMREATCNTYIQDIPIPKGTKIMISSCATNADENLWGSDALDFNPYRWLIQGDNGEWNINYGGGATSNYAMLTFSQGHRICIGQGFARAEFACMLAGWIDRFEFRLKDKEAVDMNQVKSGITVKPAKGLRLSVKIAP